MGKGNLQKAQQKREKNQKKLADQKKVGSVTTSVEKAMTIQCAFCKQMFLGSSSKNVLNDHIAKHTKKTWDDCFPGLVIE